MSRILVLLLISSPAFAAHLVADPVSVPAGDTITYQLTIDGQTVTSTPRTNSDGKVQLFHDLSTLSNGAHTVTIRTVSALWGAGPQSAPFTFSAAAPDVPSGVSLAP